MKNNIIAVFGIVGFAILAIINLAAVGWGLYLWASVGVAFKIALWSTFKLWVIGIIVGITSLGIAFYLENTGR